MHLNWRPQVNAICRKMYHGIHSLKQLNRFIHMSTRILLTQTVLLLVMDYGDVVFSYLNEELTNKLNRLLNVCIKYIFGLRKYDHVTPYRNFSVYAYVIVITSTHSHSSTLSCLIPIYHRTYVIVSNVYPLMVYHFDR